MFHVDMDAVREQIQEHLRDYLASQGIDIITNGGQYFRCINPEHPDKNPSANIIPNTNNREWKCHGCGLHGDIFTAAHLLEGKPVGNDEGFYQDTVLYLAEKYGIPVETGEMSAEETFRFRARRAMQFASRYLVENDPNDMFNVELDARGWTLEQVRRLGIGQVTDFEDFKSSMLAHDFTTEFLEKIDLCGRNAKWMFNGERMVFTQFDHKGRPVGFASRNLRYEEEKEEGKETQKYHNTRSTGLYDKSRYLYGIDGANEHPERTVFIFEGQADVVTYRIKTGQSNCVAMGGTALSSDHIDALRDLTVSRICLCLDGDDTGRKKTTQIVEAAGGNPGLSVQVMTMPSAVDEADVDSFIRKHGVESWNEAKATAKSAFEWRLANRHSDEDIDHFVQAQVKTILNENEPLKRWAMIQELARATDTPEDTIKGQVEYFENQNRTVYEQRLRAISEKASEKLSKNPRDGQMILAMYERQRESLDREYGTDVFSTDFQTDMVRTQRERELKTTPESGLKLGWRTFDGKTMGIPAEDTIFFVGGKANVGKTSLFANFALQILENNTDVVTLVYTIDDSAAKFLPRLAAHMTGLPTHWITKPRAMYGNLGDDVPAHLLPAGHTTRQSVIEAGNEAYLRIQKMMETGRLQIMDSPMSGGTWSFADRWVKKVRKQFPTSKIVLFLDNFHNLQDFGGGETAAREKYTELAELIRGTTCTQRICVFSTVEYTKMPDRVKPSNTNLAESRKMEYVADGIIHLVNHMHEFRTLPGKCKVYWKDFNDMETITDSDGFDQSGPRVKPVVEMMFGKSKISSFKGSIYLKFDPDTCLFTEVPIHEQRSLEEADAAQEWQRGK